MLFEAYQNKIEKLNVAAKEFGETIGKMTGLIQAETPAERDREVVVAMLLMIKLISDTFLDSVNDLEEELQIVGLADKRQKDINFIKETLQSNIQINELHEAAPQYLSSMKALGLFYSLKDELLNKRRVKYLNNIIEQDHRFVKKRVRACLGYRSFDTAERTLQGVEAVNMIRKGQLKRISRDDAQGQAKFIASLFQVAA